MGEVSNQLSVGERLSDRIIQFYKPKPPVRLEVVFVHGLEHEETHRDAYWKTWLTRDGIPDNVWPMTWIPDEFRFAQVFALSYDSSIKQTATDGRMDLYSVGDQLVQEMVEFGRIGQNGVPVVFVCHGFGGLVAKQIVVSGKGRFSDYCEVQNLLKNIDAFFFYSTPHHGSHSAKSPSYIKGVKGGAKGPLLENNEVLNTETSRLNFEFERSKHPSWLHYNVGEKHETSQYRQMVVPEASSRNGTHYLALNDNHFDICKPKTKRDSGYQFLTKCLQEVLNRSVVRLPPAVQNLVLESLVGLEEQEQRVKSMLQEVSIVGLIGMGGSGKTTLAKLVYRSMCEDYEKSCYLDDVKSKATLDEVLITLLRHFEIKNRKTGGFAKQSDFEDSKQSYLEDLKVFVKEHKVLVVVDDVGTAENFDRMLEDMDFLNGNNDSKMIVTCRNWQLLKKQVPKVRKYEMVLLNASGEDTELFSYHVYKRARTEDQRREVQLDMVSRDSLENSMVDFKSLRDEAVKACGGLPLSLEVMGSYFGGCLQDADISRADRLEYWRGALQKLNNAEPLEGEAENDRLWKTLQVSYEALHENEKEMFLDIACFFCGSLRYDERTLLRIWGGQPGKWNEFLNLKERCLVKANGGIVTMHDQLRDMGRSVVKDQGRVSLKEKTRLWEYKDVSKLLHSEEPSSTLQGLSLEEWRKELETIMEERTSSIFKDLKMILFKVFKLDKFIINCPKLRLLNFHRVERRTIEAIDMKDSSCVQWLSLEGSNIAKVPKFVWSCTELCVLNMRDCIFLKRLQQSIGSLVNLLELDLKNGKSLKRLPKSIGNLVKLSKLDLSYCYEFTTLTVPFGKLVKLLELDLSFCFRLTRLPESIGDLVNLSKLDLRGCNGLTRLPESIGDLVNLSELDLCGCHGLIGLPESISNLVNLSMLDLHDCNGLTRLPESIGDLVNLSELDLCGCHGLIGLPESIGNLVNLSMLDLHDCNGLTRLPESIGNLVNLSMLDLHHCNGLTRLLESIGNLDELCMPDLHDCNGLTRLPESIGNLVNLSTLDLHDHNGLTRLPESIGNLVNLSELDLRGCCRLRRLPESIGKLMKLPELDLSLCFRLRRLPESIGDLVNLSKLDLRGCRGLIGLPESIGNLVNLSKLDLRGCRWLIGLPESIGNLVNLSKLDLRGCRGLIGLPESIGNLVNLLTLDLCGCHGLIGLPESIGNLVNLSSLDLSGCDGLTRLPESIGNLVKLPTHQIYLLQTYKNSTYG